jgi:transcriptional regulator with XRE-family HTH domain
MLSRMNIIKERLDSGREPGEHPPMSNLEGALARKWRLFLGLTQDQVGQACPRSVTPHRISDIEGGRNSASVDTLLNVIHGLEKAGKTKLGTTDQQRLVAFFQGPDGAEAARLAARQLRDLAGHLEPR